MVTNNSSNYSPTQFAVQVGGANGTLSSLALGSSGQVLTSAGAGNAPSFTTVSSGNFTLISSTTASNQSTVSITSGFSSSYKYMKLVITGLKVVQGGGTYMRLRVSTNGGSSYDSGSNYSYTTFYHASDSGNDWNRGSAQTGIIFVTPIPESGTSTDNGACDIDIFNIASATQYKLFSGQNVVNINGVVNVQEIAASYNSATAVNAIQFDTNNGQNIFAGVFNLYGIT